MIRKFVFCILICFSISAIGGVTGTASPNKHNNAGSKDSKDAELKDKSEN